MPEWAFVALGSNLGDRDRYLALARDRLASLPDTKLACVSSVDETYPIGPPTQGAFLNQMALLYTNLSPRSLLNECHEIERQAGRTRSERWGPRTLDLDIVCYGGRVLNEPDLVLPHPEFPNRDFWQREVAELKSYAK
ncbi:MAG: 2-amino-4-hydroxy-6-hydroxymethyldihydropteridine diphosphokinase [Gemmatimonadales bacterium]|jgi:2-amino-4-hydroxy-6-hydroxymethyldihydropteridine diphosphokinase